jgi:hypothetical protein
MVQYLRSAAVRLYSTERTKEVDVFGTQSKSCGENLTEKIVQSRHTASSSE